MDRRCHNDSVGAETFGERIRRERLKLGLTQRQLADRVGVSVPHISKLESDRDRPSDDLIVRLARVFKVDPDELRLVARRLPDEMMERMAARPSDALEFLRKWSTSGRRGRTDASG